MKTRTIAISTILASLLALAGCAQGTSPAARTASAHPMLGFASPAGGPTEASESPRFEGDRMLPKPVVMTDKWAR
jgi:hypothetical protein